MDKMSRESQEPYELSPEAAAELVAAHRRLCGMLLSYEITHVSQIPDETHGIVRIHVITCSEQHHPIAGLITPSD